jgi:5-methylcytosine-specific restriction enzyme A
MPRKPRRPCSSPGCPRLTEEQYCEHHRKQAEAHYDKYERDPVRRAWYANAWPKIRKRYILTHPLCDRCLREGRVVPAEEVHHIIPLAKGGTHSESNLMSLCKSCHSTITAKEGGRWERRGSC